MIENSKSLLRTTSYTIKMTVSVFYSLEDIPLLKNILPEGTGTVNGGLNFLRVMLMPGSNSTVLKFLPAIFGWGLNIKIENSTSPLKLSKDVSLLTPYLALLIWERMFLGGISQMTFFSSIVCAAQIAVDLDHGLETLVKNTLAPFLSLVLNGVDWS